ncbi:hypothetical protein CR513_44398, partial [Mucuna pruriens]
MKMNQVKMKGRKSTILQSSCYPLSCYPNLAVGRSAPLFGINYYDIAVFSNSAGLHEYDHNDSKVRILEGAIGIKVIRHRVKKPAGTAEEIEKHFGCEASQLIMVGDQPFTDIVYCNQNGFLTILTEPLSLAGEPFIVKKVLEVFDMSTGWKINVQHKPKDGDAWGEL